MKVLLVSVKSEVTKGGIAVWTNHYLSGCEAVGIQCDLVNTEIVGKRATNLTAKRNFRDEFIRTRRIIRELNCKLRQNCYDIAHLNTNVGLLGIVRDYYVAKKIVKHKIPLVVHFHCDIPYWVRNVLIRLYLKKLLKISNANFVLCESSHRYLKREYHADSIFIPNFVDEKLIVDQKRINPEIKKICFVGRVSSAKGAEEIFEVAKEFAEIQFELVGEVSIEVQSWEKPSNIELMGILSHDETIKVLDESDVFLFPSHTEGFSLALAESMARGVPVIATDVGANSDMLEDQGGIVVKIADNRAMVEAIKKLSDPLLRENMSAWCIKKVRENYTTNRVMEKMKQIYGNVMEE